jgi:serine/threonine protein kinase
MEWLDGETLFERMARKPLTIAESVLVMTRVAAAVGAIHRRGVVHRDLKPSNLYLAQREIERVTLIDFGIARLPEMQAELTAPGTMLGTPAYVAPEQARNAPEVDARADVFSIGCILYKCLAGRGPFICDDGLSVLLKVVLGARFEIASEGAEHRLRGERDAFEATRTLLGRTTPCVGRERELALLEATFAHTIAEGTASVVLITGAAGMGKSRVGHELLRRLREQRKAAAVWIARGDPMSAGSAFSLLGQALRRALGLRDGEPVEARRKRIRARTRRHGSGAAGSPRCSALPIRTRGSARSRIAR